MVRVDPRRPRQGHLRGRTSMAKPRARPHRIAICLLALAACDPYQRSGAGDASYGPADPATFPPANLGTHGDRTRAGQGPFTATPAFIAGQPAAYFAYPLPAATPMSDPLAVAGLGAPPAYAFD